MSRMDLMKAIGPMIRTGMEAIGPMMICTILMSMDISREKEKEKERKARKARMMMAKEEDQEMAKVSPTMFNLRPHRLLPYRTNSNNKLTTLQQHQALVMVSLHLQRLNQHLWMFWQPPMKSKSTVDALVEQDRTNVMKWHGRTEKYPRSFLPWLEVLAHFVQVYNGRPAPVPREVALQRGDWWGFMEAVGKRHIIVFIWILWEDRDTISSWTLWRDRGIRWAEECFSFHIVQPDLACENGLAFHSDNSAPPTVCILDLGCTGAMGSRRAVEAFCSYVDSHPNSGLWYGTQPTSSRFFFANSQQSQVHWETCDIHVWQWMKHSVHRFRHCRRRWCPIVDVTSKNEKPWIPIRTYSREGFFCPVHVLAWEKWFWRQPWEKWYLILDLQDVAWYMSQVHFKTPIRIH